MDEWRKRLSDGDTVTIEALPPPHTYVDHNFRPIKIIVYRNGDELDPGTVVMVTRREYKHWIVFLDGLTRKLNTVTAVHRVYDTDGVRIENFDDLRHGGEYVAVERPPFIPCMYGARRVAPVSARTFHVPWVVEEPKTSFLEDAEGLDIYMKKQGYGSLTGLPYPLDGIVVKSPHRSFNADYSMLEEEKLNNAAAYVARQVVEEVVSSVERDTTAHGEANKENAPRTTAKNEQSTTTTTVITRVDGPPAKKDCNREFEAEAGSHEGKGAEGKPDPAIVPESGRKQQEEGNENEGKDEVLGEVVAISETVQPTAVPTAEPAKQEVSDAQRPRNTVNANLMDTSKDKKEVVGDKAAEMGPAKSPRVVRAAPHKYPASSRIDRPSRLPAIRAPNSTRVEKKTEKKRIAIQPTTTTLPPIDNKKPATEKKVKITDERPQVAVVDKPSKEEVMPYGGADNRSTRDDADIGRLSARTIKITGGWGGSERHLELYNDDDIPMRYAIPRSVTLGRLNDRQLFYTRRFESIHSYQKYPKDIYYYYDSDLDDFDPDLCDI